MYAIPLPQNTDASTVALRLLGQPGLLWLDGCGGQSDEGRWSFLGSDPVQRVRVEWGEPDPLSVLGRIACGSDRIAAPVQGAPAPGRVPLWAGYVGYDAFWSGRERRLGFTDQPAPVLWLGRYDAVVAIDHQGDDRAFVVGDDRTACERLLERISGTGAVEQPRAVLGEVQREDPEIHGRSVRAALDYIAAGEIYQVNLARCWSASYRGAPLALWLRMRSASPVPLGFYLDAGDHAVLGSTMERFLGWEGPGATLVTRPIKGTIKRRGDQDEEEARRLRSDEKERAENAMIVDLMRNDLGRVAEVGTVQVTAIMEVEPYANLSHLVSTVSCRTRSEVTLPEIMHATFPPGSVTGTPKLRAIEIIEELERVPREIYTGALGYLDRAGGLSLAVSIRTAVIRSGRVRYLAGGGLVEASVVEKEIAETELKARVFLDAVGAMGEAGRDAGSGRPTPIQASK